jgi:hypothetical protein
VHHRTSQINHELDATNFQFINLTFVYSSTCFGRFPTHYQELNDCSGSLWLYLRIVVIVVLCSWSGRPAEKLLHQVGDLFELNVKLRCQKVKTVTASPTGIVNKYNNMRNHHGSRKD